jgi:hypothetical protein
MQEVAFEKRQFGIQRSGPLIGGDCVGGPAQLRKDETTAKPGLGHLRLQSESGIAGDQRFIIAPQFGK